jgi:AAA family ATP:ADP antiporter
MSAITVLPEAARRRSAIDRCLSLFAEVHSGEGTTVLLLAVNNFSLLASYYLLKTAREALILSENGAEVKSYAAAAQAAILLLAVPLYGALASRLKRIHLINGVMLFFALHLLVFHQLASHDVHVGVPFFLWTGVVNLMVVAQFWAFASDAYSLERGQRLFPLIGVGGSLGAWAGARLAAALLQAEVAPAELLLMAAAGLAACVGLNTWTDQRESAIDPAQAGPPAPPGRLGPAGGFRLVLTNRYLTLIAALIIVANIVNSVGEFLLGKLVVAHAMETLASGRAGGLSRGQLIGAFYGDFFGWVNLVSVLVQLFAVSRVFKRIGIGGALFVLPIVAFGSYATLAVLPFLRAVCLGKVVENSVDYSLQNTLRHALYLPTSTEAKYKGKQAIDAFCSRVGDLLQALVVLGGVQFGLGLSQFALMNELFIGLWLVIAAGVFHEYKRIAKSSGAPPRDAAARPARAPAPGVLAPAATAACA